MVKVHIACRYLEPVLSSGAFVLLLAFPIKTYTTGVVPVTPFSENAEYLGGLFDLR